MKLGSPAFKTLAVGVTLQNCVAASALSWYDRFDDAIRRFLVSGEVREAGIVAPYWGGAVELRAGMMHWLGRNFRIRSKIIEEMLFLLKQNRYEDT